MVAMVNNEQLSWLSQAPLWHQMGDLSDPATQQRFVHPAILRFAGDEFMEELAGVLAYHPERLDEWQARFETWEKPMVRPRVLEGVNLPLSSTQVSKLTSRLARQAIKRIGTLPVTTGNALATNKEVPPARKLKLYQPIQQRYYLVTASLVCRQPGLPDRRVDGGKQERMGFVLRRIFLSESQTEPDDDPTLWDEYAYIVDESSARWQQVKHNDTDSADHLLPGEELQGMFPMEYDDADGRKRRLWGGVIPVGRREAYLSTRKKSSTAADETEATATAQPDPRIFILQMQVTGPWAQLVQQSQDENKRVAQRGENTSALHELFSSTPSPDDDDTLSTSREQIQTVSWYLLLDFERFLYNHAHHLWDALVDDDISTLDPESEEPLVRWLKELKLDTTLSRDLGSGASENLWQVLVEIAQDQEIGRALESVDVPYDQNTPDERWPKFRFPLAEPRTRGPFPFIVQGLGDLAGDDIDFDDSENDFAISLARLEELVEAALSPKRYALN